MKKALLSLVLSTLLLLSLIVPVGAASVDGATIDKSLTASLSIYKYDITSAERDEVWTTGSYTSTGVTDLDGVNAILGNPTIVNTLPNGDTSYGYAIKGVEFTYLKLADVQTISNNGVIETLYGFDSEDVLAILGLSFDDATTAQGGVFYFRTDALNAALADSIAANATAVKDSLESYVTANGGTALAETDSYGYVSVEGLELGLYLVVETKVPEHVICTTNPFFVSLPMTTVDGSEWNYDVTVYPKNQTGMPTLEKSVREALSSTGKTEEFGKTATASIGDVVDYKIDSKLPTITSKASYLTAYTFVDTVESGIAYNKNDVVLKFTDGNGAVLATWTETDETAKFTVTYGENSMTVAMTEAGLSEINPAYSDSLLTISYSATVTEGASLGDDSNDNEVTLTWKRTSQSYYDTLKACCHVNTYGIDLTKEFSDGNGDFSKVNFYLENSTDGYYVTAEKTEGIYYVTGTASSEADATVFVPTSEGKLVIRGLEDDSYVLTETATAAGYRLLAEDICIDITTAESDIVCTTCTAKLLTASASINYTEIEMDSDGTSENALVPLTVVNNKELDLPDTGDSGVLISGIGAAVALVILFLLFGSKKKSHN